MSETRDLPLWAKWSMAIGTIAGAVLAGATLLSRPSQTVVQKELVTRQEPAVKSPPSSAQDPPPQPVAPTEREPSQALPSLSANRTFTLDAGSTIQLRDLDCVVSWTHQGVAGTPVASVRVSPSTGPQVTGAALGPGTTVHFTSAGHNLALEVLAINWAKETLSFRVKEE